MKKQKNIPQQNLKGVGIDIISRHKVEHLLMNSPNNIASRILTSKEKACWKTQNYSVPMLAKFLVAKEAFFKAMGGQWMGPDGFKHFEVLFIKKGHFKVSDISRKNSIQTGGVFFEEANLFGAQCITWS